jgi:hypothetical protein
MGGKNCDVHPTWRGALAQALEMRSRYESAARAGLGKVPARWWIHIDPVRKFTYARMLGVVTYDDMRDMQCATRLAPKFNPDFGFLFDLTHACAFDVSSEEFMSLTRLTAHAQLARRAILLKESHTFGIGKMWEAARNAESELPVLVCLTVAEAAAWLRIPDLAAGIAPAGPGAN